MASIPGLSGSVPTSLRSQVNQPSSTPPFAKYIANGSLQYNSGPKLSAAPQPTANETSGAYTGGSTTSTGTGTLSVDPQAVAYYDNLQGSVNNNLGRLDNQYNVGLGNISNSYNDAFNKLQAGKDIATRDYNTQKDQTLQDNVQAKGNIDQSVYSQNNSLQRLLGAHGYSGSANKAASYLAAQQGSQQRNQVQNTFGRNQQALDTSFGDYNNQYQGSLGDLGRQKSTQEQQLQATIDQNKSNLLQQLAGITQARAQAQGKTYQEALGLAQPYQQQVDALGSTIDNLGRTPAITAQQATYQAPTLDAYNFDKAQAPGIQQQQDGAASNVSPYLSLLLGQKKQNNPLGA